MGSLQKVLEKYHMEKWFQRDNLIILVLAGILLVVIALPTEKGEDTPDLAGQTENQTISEQAVDENKSVPEEYASLYEYTSYLEEKLENILTDMNGVGKVEVMITLEASEERVVEKDEPLVRNNTTESDSTGGTRNIYQMESGQETVYENLEDGEIPYVTKTILPEVSGVLIVAEGAGKGNTTKNITEIAQALFDLEAHKIKVVSMGEK